MQSSIFPDDVRYEANRDTPGAFFVRHLPTLNQADYFHFHKNLEILCVKKGNLIVEVERGKTYTAKEGQMVFLDEWMLHRIPYCSEGDYLMLLIPDAFSKGFRHLREMHAYTNVVFDDNEHGLLFSLAFSIYDFVRSDNHASQLPEKEKRCLRHILDALFSEIYVRAKFTEANRNINELFPLITYINQNIESHFTVKDLSYLFGYSPRYLSKIFASYSGGMGLKEYIDTMRLNHAKALLRHNETVQAACEKSGFGSLRSFHRIFYEFEQTTPALYRKNFR